MKTQWWFAACATALLAVASTGAVAQDRNDQDRYHRNRWQDDQNRGNRENHDKFDDHDRQAAREWYEQHRDYRGVRDSDRLAPEYESRLQEGYTLDARMRRMARPAPYELTQRLAPPPPGYRYLLINGHVVVVDRGYRVHDAIHFELNLGR